MIAFLSWAARPTEGNLVVMVYPLLRNLFAPQQRTVRIGERHTRPLCSAVQAASTSGRLCQLWCRRQNVQVVGSVMRPSSHHYMLALLKRFAHSTPAEAASGEL